MRRLREIDLYSMRKTYDLSLHIKYQDKILTQNKSSLEPWSNLAFRGVTSLSNDDQHVADASCVIRSFDINF